MKKFGDVAHFYLGTGLELMHDNHKWKMVGIDVGIILIRYFERSKSMGNTELRERASFDVKPILYPLSCLKDPKWMKELYLVFGGAFRHAGAFKQSNFIDNILYSSWKSIRTDQLLWLLENHFNVFNLPETDYINKQTLTN